MKLGDLELNTRAWCALKNDGRFETIEQLCSASRQELHRIPNLGRVTVDLIEAALHKNGLSLRDHWFEKTRPGDTKMLYEIERHMTQSIQRIEADSFEVNERGDLFLYNDKYAPFAQGDPPIGKTGIASFATGTWVTIKTPLPTDADQDGSTSPEPSSEHHHYSSVDVKTGKHTVFDEPEIKSIE